jgi:acyl transferase domain-containing protein
MDPQQRLFKVTLEALEDAAILPETLKHSKTDVFFDLPPSEYQQQHHQTQIHRELEWNDGR